MQTAKAATQMMSKRTPIACLCLFGTLCLLAARAETQLDLPNPGFEDQTSAWQWLDGGMSQVTESAAHAGKYGLRVEDRDESKGSNVYSSTLKALSGAEYTLRFWARNIQGDGLAVYLVFYDEDNQALSRAEFGNETKVTLPDGTGEWKQFTLNAVAPEGAARMKVWIHSFISNTGIAELDDFILTEGVPN